MKPEWKQKWVEALRSGKGEINMSWMPVKYAPEGNPLMTRITDREGIDRNEKILIRHGNLWFESTYPDTPTHYRELTKIEKENMK